MSLKKNDSDLKDFFRDNYADESLPVSSNVWNNVAQNLEGMRLSKGLPTSGEANNADLKDFFSSAYSDSPLTVSPEVWDTVAADLEKKRKKRRGGYWLWAAVIGIPLILGTTYLFMPPAEDQGTDSMATGITTEENFDQNKSDHSTDPSSDGSADADGTYLESPSDALVDDQTSTNESGANQQFDQTSTSDAGTDSFSPTNNGSNNEQIDSDVSIGINSNSDTDNDSNNSSDEIDISTDNLIVDEQPNHQNEINPVIGNNDAANSGSSDDERQLGEKEDEMEKVPPTEIGPILTVPAVYEFSMVPVELKKPDGPTVSPWEVSVYAGTGKRSRFVANDQTPDDINSKKFQKLNPERKRYQQTGVNFGYNIGNNFTIGMGLQTSLWRYRSREFTKLVVKEPAGYDMDAPVGRVQADPSELDQFYATTPADTLLFRIRMSQKLRYFSVPLSLKIKFGKNKIQPYIRGGISANFLYWQRTNLIFRSVGLVRDIERVKVDGLKRFHISGQGAFGFQWELAPRISMFAEGVIDIPFQSFYKHQGNDAQIKSRGLGGSFGLIFKL